jgi:hypothetical protein
MIILPDRNIPRAKILIPMHKKHWITPSQAQKKDPFGNEDNTKFRIQAKSNDGVIIWTGWFDDREDFDVFLWAVVTGTIKQEKALWDLPTPGWQPYLGDLITYQFATLTFLSSPTGSNQNYTAPNDWNNGNNTIEVVGGGGTGGFNSANSVTQNDNQPGGGGGAYSKISNQILTVGGTYVYNIGAAGVGNTSTKVSGGDTWFGNTTLATSFVGAKGGNVPASANLQLGGIGGAAASGVGTVKYSGGNGGIIGLGQYSGSGGGGAAGPYGNGGNGGNDGYFASGGYYSAGGGGGNGGGSVGQAGDAVVSYRGGNGGNGYLGASSAGGSGGRYDSPYVSSTAGTNGGGGGGGGSDGSYGNKGSNGSIGQEWSSSYGTGGGGGGGGYYYDYYGTEYNTTSLYTTPGNAGGYGGGGGGKGDSGEYYVGAGGQGLLVITYTPGMTYPDLFTFGFF